MESLRSLLKQLAGTVSIPSSNSDFWTGVLGASPHPLTKHSPEEVDAVISPVVEALVANNAATGNFQRLLRCVEDLVRAVKSPREVPVGAINGLVITRTLIRMLVERLSGPEVAPFFVDPEGADGDALIVSLLSALVQVVSKADSNPNLYLLQLEAIKCLVVTGSSQLYLPSPSATPGAHPAMEAMFETPIRDQAPALVEALLRLYVQRPLPPPRAPLFAPAPVAKAAAEGGREGGAGAGLVGYMGQATVSLFTMPLRAAKWMFIGSGAPSPSPLADAALLLLLVLVHQPEPLNHGDAPHPYKSALSTIVDEASRPDVESAESGRASSGASPSVPYSALYQTLTANMVDEKTTLLLYSLLQGCSSFREYLLCRSDLDRLVLPLLEMLYGLPERTNSHTYMLLIVILILSQDRSFAANVHKMTLPSVPWYKERLLHNTSLGSLLVLILLRTAQYNLNKLQDVYLQTNTLAALANLAPHMQALSGYASMRTVQLLDIILRKINKITRELAADPALSGEGALRAGGQVPQPTLMQQSELQVYTDFLRIGLEILNSVLTSALPANPDMVYALLHKQEVFKELKGQPWFGELVDNVLLVIDYFNRRVDKAREAAPEDFRVDKVLETVKDAARSWRPDLLRLFPELRFTYEEESNPEEFFLPYVWSLVGGQPGFMGWDQSRIMLFSTGAPAVEDPATAAR